MNPIKARCLVLSCGNTLRGDDGLGPFLSIWAEEHFANRPEIVILTRQQWTPDLAADLAEAETALFIDCTVDAAPGEVRLLPVEPATPENGIGSHHMDAAELLGLARELYASLPRKALFLTVGAGSMELSENFSAAVQAALPRAQKELLAAVESLLEGRR